MEIKVYTPKYKKAILDLCKITHPNDWEPALWNLETDKCICYVAFEDTKFKGYILAAEFSPDTVLVNHWATKDTNDKRTGVQLALYGRKQVKELGYKYMIFYRSKDKQFYKEEL